MNSGTPVADDEPATGNGLTRGHYFIDLLKRIGRTLVVALALLSFPSVLPWMVGFWIACHTVLAKMKHPAWVPLLICLIILIVKLVPRTPAILMMGCVLAVVFAVRFKHRRDPTRIARWWIGPVTLWIAWGFLFVQWRSFQTPSRSAILHPSRPVVCIGDSLTQGLLPDHGFPEQLKPLVTIPVVNLGFSGISSVQGLGQMERVLKHDPQIVVIELGGHDFLKGHSRAATKTNLVEMIEMSRAKGAEVILMEIPRGFIFDPFASLEREIAYEYNVQLIADTWLRQIVIFSPIAPPGKWMPGYQLSDDGIHSNAKGSKAIARRVARALQNIYGDDVLVADRHR